MGIPGPDSPAISRQPTDLFYAPGSRTVPEGRPDGMRRIRLGTSKMPSEPHWKGQFGMRSAMDWFAAEGSEL